MEENDTFQYFSALTFYSLNIESFSCIFDRSDAMGSPHRIEVPVQNFDPNTIPTDLIRQK